MNQKVLITGGSGLLAVNWAMTIRDHCRPILALHERTIKPKRVETQFIDLESIPKLIDSFTLIKPEVVIHTAGLTSVELCESDWALATHVNIDLAVNVAKATAEMGIPFVHISTDHLFDGNDSFVDELQPVSPLNNYGRTKADAEIRVLEENPDSLVIRTNFYGWSPSYRRSFSDIIIESLRQKKEITLFRDVTYSPILTELLVKTVHELLDINAKGIYNVVGDDRISKHEFGMKIAEHFHLDSSLIKAGLLTDQKQLVNRPMDMSLSNKKVNKLLNKKIGGINEQLERLRQQEASGIALEILNL